MQIAISNGAAAPLGLPLRHRRAPALTQANIARALRAAKSAGDEWRIEIAPSGVISILRGEIPPAGAAAVAAKREWVL
jgi:hypothetical protein